MTWQGDPRLLRYKIFLKKLVYKKPFLNYLRLKKPSTHVSITSEIYKYFFMKNWPYSFENYVINDQMKNCEDTEYLKKGYFHKSQISYKQNLCNTKHITLNQELTVLNTGD